MAPSTEQIIRALDKELILQDKTEKVETLKDLLKTASRQLIRVYDRCVDLRSGKVDSGELRAFFEEGLRIPFEVEAADRDPLLMPVWARVAKHIKSENQGLSMHQLFDSDDLLDALELDREFLDEKGYMRLVTIENSNDYEELIKSMYSDENFLVAEIISSIEDDPNKHIFVSLLSTQESIPGEGAYEAFSFINQMQRDTAWEVTD